MVTATAYHEAERAVVGAALLDPNAVRFAIDHCAPEDFADPRLGMAYSLIIGHRSARLGTDEITIAKAATERGVKIEPLELFDLRHQTPTAANIGYYAKIVHEGGVRRRLRKAGSRMIQLADSGTPMAEALAHARSEWDSVRTSVGTTLDAKPLSEVLEADDEYDWLIPNLLERKDRVIITGGEGAGKSTLVRQIGIMAAAGLHPTLHTSIDPVRVLVVDAENTERQWSRAVRTLTLKARTIGSADPSQTVHLACTPRIDITTDKDLGAIHRLIDEHAPDLLLIGPLYRLVPRAINDDDAAAPVIAALDTMRDRNLALVIEAHAGHAIGADGHRNLRPRGSSALLGWPEFGFGIAPDPSEDMGGGLPPSLFRLVRWRGDRDERAWPHSLRRGGEWPWQDDNPTATHAHIRRLRAQSGPQLVTTHTGGAPA